MLSVLNKRPITIKLSSFELKEKGQSVCNAAKERVVAALVCKTFYTEVRSEIQTCVINRSCKVPPNDALRKPTFWHTILVRPRPSHMSTVIPTQRYGLSSRWGCHRLTHAYASQSAIALESGVPSRD